jgi:nitroreductase
MTALMSVSEAVASRRSIRRFLPDPVERAVLERVLAKAQRAPSGGDTQPWNAVIVTGAELARISAAIIELTKTAPLGAGVEYPIYPAEMDGRYAAQRMAVGQAMFTAAGIARGDRAARFAQMRENWNSFGAPVQLFTYTPSYMGKPQWSDIGMWLQTVMLLLREEGLDSCAQEIWAMYGEAMKGLLGIPEGHIFFCGMAIGRRDPEAAINTFPVPRIPFEDVVRFEGF